MRNLNHTVTTIEDNIITLGGPALAVSGILAGVDLLTGGGILKQASLLAYVWAISLLLCLDFQVLSLGARAHQVYLSNKTSRRKLFEIALAVIIAAAISYVSIQMQSIIARSNSAGIDINTATVQLGINPIALIWERSALVLVLIFLSGWFREMKQDRTEQNPQEANTTQDEAIKQLTEQVSLLAQSMGQITATVTEVKTTVTQITAASLPALPMRTEQSEPLEVIESEPVRKENKKELIRQCLQKNPKATIDEIMVFANVARSYASTARSQIQNEQKGATL